MKKTSEQVKITCYFHTWKYQRCYGYIISRLHDRRYVNLVYKINNITWSLIEAVSLWQTALNCTWWCLVDRSRSFSILTCFVDANNNKQLHNLFISATGVDFLRSDNSEKNTPALTNGCMDYLYSSLENQNTR